MTTLGKIDVQGTDAGAFLNKIYCNAFAKLAVGKTRYGLMLREDGIARTMALRRVWLKIISL